MPNIVSQNRFINEALAAHNEYRDLHGVPPLEHESRLSGLALEWAQQLASEGSLKYRNGKYKGQDVGESIMRFRLNEANLYYLDGTKVTNEWYDEEENYDYKGVFTPNIGHFTQVVWKNTQKVGFGFCMDETGLLYVVANYYPAGNYKNKFRENVLPIVASNTRLMPAEVNLPPNEKKPENFHLKEIMSQVLNHKPDSKDTISRRIEPLNQSIDSNTYDFDEQQMRFIGEALMAHNKCRRVHGVQDLVHNPDLSEIAQEYAEKLAKMNKMVHSKNKYKGERIGENLAYSYNSQQNFYSGESATMQWYNEIHDHNFNLDHQPGTGHFTQLIWKATKEVGFGVAEAKDGSFYAVANYYPAGNFINRFVQNVPRPIY